MVGVSCASVTRISKTTNFWNTPRTYMCIHVESSQLKNFFHIYICRCTCENVYNITPDTSYTYMSHPAYGSSSYDE